ncbi:hypothetical protein [Methanospirillum lacunae]|nr:hypothetical protein [Methanospirillum lacunae]
MALLYTDSSIHKDNNIFYNQLAIIKSKINLSFLEKIQTMPTLRNNTLYTNAKIDLNQIYLIKGYNSTTDEYLYQMIDYQNLSNREKMSFSATKSEKRSTLEDYCKFKLENMDSTNPYLKYGLRYIPLG